METDEELSIFLELLKDDIFYDKKEKLLQSKGFSPNERIYLRHSSEPGWMSAIVKVLVQIARIIHLNELELYFADVHSSVEFYSPRNELEALNFIVSLIETLLSICKHLHTNILQELQTIIFGLISDFGDMNSMKAIIKRDYFCEQEELLLEWGKSNGVRTQLQIAYVKGACRCAIDERVGYSFGFLVDFAHDPMGRRFCTEVSYPFFNLYTYWIKNNTHLGVEFPTPALGGMWEWVVEDSNL